MADKPKTQETEIKTHEEESELSDEQLEEASGGILMSALNEPVSKFSKLGDQPPPGR